MYLEPRNSRLLLPNGNSLVTPEEYARRLLKEGEVPPFIKVEKSKDVVTYETIYGVSVSMDEEPLPLEHQVYPVVDLEMLMFGNIDKLPRLQEVLDTHGDKAAERLSVELSFFQKENSYLIFKLVELVKQFKSDGVVWGVGRGSSCASLLLYVLEVHDVDPLKYDIPFHELTKEGSNEYQAS